MSVTTELDVLLVDGTDTEGVVHVNNPIALDGAQLIQSGISGDTFTVQYRPNETRDWSDLATLDSSSDDTQYMNRFPGGDYKCTRTGNGDDATIGFKL